MLRSLLLLLFALVPFLVAQDPAPINVAPTDWPWWRGPTRNGIAAPNQKVPTTWSETENVLWKVPVPGRGHGSPTVVGDHVFLATAENDRKTQSVICFDRLSGKQLWQTDVHKDVVHQGGGNGKASMASSSVACDGPRVYINFLSGKAVFATCLDRSGKQVWQTKVTDYTLHQGFASSPAVFESLLLVTADNKGGAGAVAALDRLTGKVVWSQPRPKYPNYASPIVLNVAGKDQLLVSGCKLVTSYEPRTGKKLWEIAGSTEETVTSTGTDGKHIFTSGGFPRNHVAAILADGSGKVVWENTTKVYVPSMLVLNGYLYAVKDGGGAVCWKSDTGEKAWEARLDGAFSASPVLVGDTIYATSEGGKTYLFKATPDKFEQVGANQLGTEAMATPAICGGRIYFRVATQEKGTRQEWLYCVGK